MHNPYGFPVIENDWCKIRYAPHKNDRRLYFSVGCRFHYNGPKGRYPRMGRDSRRKRTSVVDVRLPADERYFMSSP
jgi:hypothetical protein